MHNFSLSASKVDCFFSCEFLFWQRYIVKPFVPPEKKAFLCGNIAHMALELFHKSANIDNKNLWKTIMRDSLKAAYEKYKVLDFIKDRTITQKEAIEVRDIIKKYLVQALVKPLPKIKHIEEFFSLKHNGVSISGKADRVDVLSPKAIKIIDYKTSKIPFSSDYAYESVQLPTYRLWLEGVYGKDITFFGEYLFLKYIGTGRERQTFAITDDLVESALEKYQYLNNFIKEGKEYKKNREYKYCGKNCEYFELCHKED